MKPGAKRLEGAMQVYFQGARLAPGVCGGFRQRVLLQSQLLYGLTLPRRQARDGITQSAGFLVTLGREGGITDIGMRVERVLIMQLPSITPAMAAQRVDGAPAGDGA